MINFLDLHKINEPYRSDIDLRIREVLDSGWYLLGKQNAAFCGLLRYSVLGWHYSGKWFFIGSNVAFCNDKHPRSKNHLETFLKTIVHQGASIGANATILHGITIGEYAVVVAGRVVTKDVKPHTTVVGNPAIKIGDLPR